MVSQGLTLAGHSYILADQDKNYRIATNILYGPKELFRLLSDPSRSFFQFS
jgi:hypothetical protein